MRDRFDSVKEADISGFQLPTGKNAATKFVETAVGDARSGCTDWVLSAEGPTRGQTFLSMAGRHRPTPAL